MRPTVVDVPLNENTGKRNVRAQECEYESSHKKLKNETLNNHTDRCMKSDNNYHRPIQENK